MTLETELWNKEHQVFDSIINHLPHFVFWKDKDLVFRGCNLRFAEQFGFKTQQEIVGKTDNDFPWDEQHSQQYLDDDKKVIETGKAKLLYEEMQKQSDGEIKVVLVSKIPLFDSNLQVQGILGIYTDITERKKMELALKTSKEIAEAASHAKTEFMRNMSHDLRTPLTGIIGMAKMISQKPKTNITLDAAEDIHQAGMSLLNLLNEIIQTVQAESGKTISKKNCFSLSKTFLNLTNMFKPALKHKNLKLETYFDDNIPDLLYGEELLLHRIILNLLGNAVKFTEKGSISLEANLSQKKSETVIIKLVVQDTGIGIPQDKQKFIFEKFTRLTPSYTNNFNGSGLGLFMVKEFIQKLGGEIALRSTEGKGSTFTCTVHFKLPTPAQLKKYYKTINDDEVEIKSWKQQSKRHSGIRQKPLHALLIEDSLLPQKIATSLLIEAGYKVEIAETAADALKQSQGKVFDIIYMDLGLPDGNGIDVTISIRQDKTNPNTNTPIVALTAHSDPDIINRCFEAGIQQILDKPLTPEKIQAAEFLIGKPFTPVTPDEPK